MCFLVNFGRLLVCKTYNILIMSTSSFDESISSDKHDSDIDFIRGYEIEGQQAADLPPMTDTDEEAVPYADDPVADEEWTKQYEKEIEEEKQLQQQHQDRLEKRVAISEWYVLHGLSNTYTNVNCY